MLSCFSRVRLFETLWAVAHQAPLSIGFSGKNTGVCCHALLQGIFPAQGLNLHLLCLPALAGGFFITSTSWEAQSRGSSQPTALQADSLPSEPPGKPMNTGVGSLSILQGIFPFQESNRGLLHCRRILDQLSYPQSPLICLPFNIFYHCLDNPPTKR